MSDANDNSSRTIIPEDRVIYKPENGIQVAYDKSSMELISGKIVDFWDNGNFRHRKEYQDGQPHGLSEIFFEHGALWMETPFKNGKRHGVLRTLWKSGLTMMRLTYKDGLSDGVEEVFDEDGSLVSSIVYRNGKIVI